VGPLPQSVQLLVVVGLELLVDLVRAPAVAQEHAGARKPEVFARFREQLFAGRRAREAQLGSRIGEGAIEPHGHREVAGDQGGDILADHNVGACAQRSGVVERPVALERKAMLRRTNAHGVVSPRRDAEQFVLVPNLEGIAVDAKCSHGSAFVWE